MAAAQVNDHEEVDGTARPPDASPLMRVRTAQSVIVSRHAKMACFQNRPEAQVRSEEVLRMA